MGVFSSYKHLKTGSKSADCQAFSHDAPTSSASLLMCSFVMCPPSPPSVIPGHFGTMQNPVEPERTMTMLDRKSNEAWNQYVQSCLTQGMLGNGVSGALWSRFNHRDLGLSTRKQAGYCQNSAAPRDVCTAVCVCASVISFCYNWSKLCVHMPAPAWSESKSVCVLASLCEFTKSYTARPLCKVHHHSSAATIRTTPAPPPSCPPLPHHPVPSSYLTSVLFH